MFRESIAHLNFCKILGPLEFFVSFWFFKHQISYYITNSMVQCFGDTVELEELHSPMIPSVARTP